MATKRDYKKEYQRDLETGKSGPGSDQHMRQKARRLYDKEGIDRTGKQSHDADRRQQSACF